MKYSFFENVLLLSISINFLQTPFLDDIFLINFLSSNSISSVKDLIRWKEVLKYFWLTTKLVTLEIIISLASIKKSLYQCHPPYTTRVSPHRVLYLKLLILYMYYLPSCNKDLFKSHHCHVLILPIEKSFRYVMKYVFNSISISFWKKNSLLTNIRNKRVIRNINLYFFDVMKNGHVFP